MNSIQTSTYAMFVRTQRVLADNKTAWTTNTKFMANSIMLGENIVSIAEEQKMQESDKTGIAQDKETARETAAELAFGVASGLRSFAADANNRELEQSVRFTEAGLGRLAETRLASTCEMIHGLGTKHLADLGEYGVTAAGLDALKAAIVSFKAVQPDARLAINKGSKATTTMRKLFTATSNLLKRQLDTKMAMFKKTDKDFYNAYFQARNIIEPGAPAKPIPAVKKVEGKA
jgi:hypothetical protein